MAFVAVHIERGRLDATQDDLGFGWHWSDVYRVRPRAPLSCPDCGHAMHAKVSSGRVRFFAHDRRAPTCTRAYETLEHHLLKLELATAVRAAGWHAELEVSNATRAWRADVLATDPDGSSRVAWEAQLSPITIDQIANRTAAFAIDQVPVCWVAVADRPWLGTVPSILVRSPSSGGKPWLVGSGILRFTNDAVADPSLTLPEFVDSVLAGQLTNHTVPRGLTLPGSSQIWQMVWTTPRDLDIAETQTRSIAVAVIRRTSSIASGSSAGTSASSAPHSVVPAGRNVPPQQDPTAAPYSEPPADFLDQLRQHLNHELNGVGQVGIGTRDPRLANGHPVYVNGRLYGVACPHPDQPSQWQDLGRILVLVPENQVRWFSRTAPLGTRMRVVHRTSGPARPTSSTQTSRPAMS